MTGIRCPVVACLNLSEAARLELPEDSLGKMYHVTKNAMARESFL